MARLPVLERTAARRRDDRHAGFTLLEVLVAVAIFSMGAVTVLAVQTNAYREYRAARDIGTARYLLQKMMGELYVSPDAYEDGEEGEFEDEPDDVRMRFTWSVRIEEIFLIGGDDDEEDEAITRRARRREGREGGEGTGTGGGFGDEEEEPEVSVWRVTAFVHYPGFRGEKHLSATTFFPADSIASDDDFF